MPNARAAPAHTTPIRKGLKSKGALGRLLAILAQPIPPYGGVGSGVGLDSGIGSGSIEGVTFWLFVQF